MVRLLTFIGNETVEISGDLFELIGSELIEGGDSVYLDTSFGWIMDSKLGIENVERRSKEPTLDWSPGNRPPSDDVLKLAS